MSHRGTAARRSSAPSPEGLMCALALDPRSVPRNRYYWVYEDARARRAHARAHAVRRLHEQLGLLFRQSASSMILQEEDRGLRIAYHDDLLALNRRIHLSPLETSLLRLLLARAPVRVPLLLQPRPADRFRVAAALERIRHYPGLPDPAGWQDVLIPLVPAAAPSNTTE